MTPKTTSSRRASTRPVADIVERDKHFALWSGVACGAVLVAILWLATLPASLRQPPLNGERNGLQLLSKNMRQDWQTIRMALESVRTDTSNLSVSLQQRIELERLLFRLSRALAQSADATSD